METSLQAIDCTATYNPKEANKTHVHPKHKRETEKTALANKTNLTLIWYAFYDFRPENRADHIFTAPGTGLGSNTRVQKISIKHCEDESASRCLFIGTKLHHLIKHLMLSQPL